MTRALLALLALASLAPACSRTTDARAPEPGATPASDPRDGLDVVGSTPPEWEAEHWLNSKPLRLSELRGKVVLVRWWTAGCPYCEATAPALRELDRTYRDRGLVVVGLYHHKEAIPLDYAVVEQTAAKYGFAFPVAVDPEWRTLDRWWEPKTKGRAFTSVSFLLDRRGVVRHVHPGGQYVKGDAAYEAMRAAIERLLAQAE